MFSKIARTALIALAVGLAALPAWALDLDQARSSGLIGERADGLVGSVKPTATPDLSALVDSINRQRLETYRNLAHQEGTPIDAVQKLAGEKEIAKARQSGWYWMDTGGSWHKG